MITIIEKLIKDAMNSKGTLNYTAAGIKGVFVFNPGDRIYKDHFPGYAVVPGSLIIHAFVTMAKDAGLLNSESNGGFQVEGFRFMKFIHPGTYAYIVKIQKNCLICRLFEKENIIASGNIVS